MARHRGKCGVASGADATDLQRLLSAIAATQQARVIALQSNPARSISVRLAMRDQCAQ